MKLCLLLISWFVIMVVLTINTSLIAYSQNAISTKRNFLFYSKESLRLQKIINANPDNYEAVEKYIDIYGPTNPALVLQVRRWMREFPKSVSFPLAMGKAYNDEELPEGRMYLLKALKIKPNMVDIWEILGGDAMRQGNEKLYQMCLKKRFELKSDNAEYFFDYLMSFEYTNSDQWQNSIFDFLKCFPNNQLGEVGLYCIAHSTTDTLEKIKLYNRIKTDYNLLNDEIFRASINELFDINLERSLTKALEIAKEWHFKARITLINNIERVDTLVSKSKFDDALNLVDITKKKTDSLYTQYDELFLLKKSSILFKKGNIKAAYDSLLIGASKAPTIKKINALYSYGNKLGKTNQTVIQDIKNHIATFAVPADSFNERLYNSNDSLSLVKCRGKVILLTFWFPACEPCREEFYYIEHVLKNTNRNDFKYIGVNAAPGQDKYVPKFITYSGVTFTAIHGSPALLNSYNVYGEPSNFIIGKDGRIMFSDFQISVDNESTLALMLQLAL